MILTLLARYIEGGGTLVLGTIPGGQGLFAVPDEFVGCELSGVVGVLPGVVELELPGVVGVVLGELGEEVELLELVEPAVDPVCDPAATQGAPPGLFGDVGFIPGVPVVDPGVVPLGDEV